MSRCFLWFGGMTGGITAPIGLGPGAFSRRHDPRIGRREAIEREARARRRARHDQQIADRGSSRSRYAPLRWSDEAGVIRDRPERDPIDRFAAGRLIGRRHPDGAGEREEHERALAAVRVRRHVAGAALIVEELAAARRPDRRTARDTRRTSRSLACQRSGAVPTTCTDAADASGLPCGAGARRRRSRDRRRRSGPSDGVR